MTWNCLQFSHSCCDVCPRLLRVLGPKEKSLQRTIWNKRALAFLSIQILRTPDTGTGCQLSQFH